MACQSSRAPENLNNGFTPLVERLHSFTNIDDTSYVSKMKDYLQGNMGSYENTLRDIENDLQKAIADDNKNEIINGTGESACTTEHDNSYNNINNVSSPNESDHDNLYIDENKCMETDNRTSESENNDIVENAGGSCDKANINEDGEEEEVDDAMSDSYTEAVNYTKDINGVSPINENIDIVHNEEMPLEAVVDHEDSEDDNCDAEFTGLQTDNGIYTGISPSKPKTIATRSQTMSRITVSECDSTSVGSDFFVERSLAAEIANSIQLGDVMCQPQEEKVDEEMPVVNESTNAEMEPRKERWTMKIKVGSTSDGSRCEIIKHVDYDDAKKSGLIKNDPVQLNEHPSMHTFPQYPVYDPNSASSDIKSVVGKRKKEKKGWRDEEVMTMTDLSTPPKKVKGGLRSDCPPFCKTNCTKIHHPLLVTARRMIENDSNTTLMFLEQVSRYYGGDLGQMRPGTEIQDPWKDTSFPLLHYLALMGKCSGCFALVDAGQSCLQAVSSNGDTVLHTLVREMYNFNCTHGHMDILLKKFTILLKEFSACLLIENYMKETPFHLLGKLISGTSQLLNVPGKYKLPYRLYQFAKNMLFACLEQYTVDNIDREVLDRQDTLGNTIAHYVAQDRASHNLLAKLLEKGAHFTILNHAQQNIENVKSMAPPAPDNEILELAEFSAKSNKYKKINKKVKVTPVSVKGAKTEAERKTEITMEQAADNFMEMLNNKLSSVEQWEPIENMKLKKKNEKRAAKTAVTSSNSPPRLQHFEAAFSHAISNQETKVENIYHDIQGKLDILVSSPPPMSNNTTISSSPARSLSISLPSISSSIADITSIHTSGPSMLLTDAIKIEKPDEPSYMIPSNHNPVSDISIVDKLCNISNSLKTMATVPNVATICSSQNKSHIDKLSHISIPNVRPTVSIPQISSQQQYPLISNVQTVARDVGMQNVFMFRPHGPPVLTHPRPRMNMVNQSLPSLVPRPPPPLQPNVSTVTSQQPLLLKTADGKLMSINVVQVSKANNTQPSNTTWHQQVNNMPPVLNVHPNVNQRPQYIDTSNLRYIAPSMMNNNFRPPDPNNMNVSSVSFANSTGVGVQHPTLMPNILPQTYRGGPISMPNLNSVQNANMLSHASLIQKIMNAQSLVSTSIQNPMITSKYDAKKNRGLEASIENLRHSAMNSTPTNTTKNKNSTTNKSRLAASLKNTTDDSAPQVIILDEESAVKSADTRELQSPSIESSQDLDSPQFRDIDGVASFMKNYLQEKGSIEDFLKFSNEKKDALAKELEEERTRMKDINKEIVVREVDIKDTRESVVGKEMEIAHLRLKLTKIQNDVNQLKNNRQTILDSCSEIEKRMKTLEDQTVLFTSWSPDTRTDK